MRATTLCGRLLGLKRTVVEAFEVVEAADGSAELVVRVRPYAADASRCSRCLRACPGYDAGTGRFRRWRGLDVGELRTFIEARAPRVRCPVHKVVAAQVSWAHPGSRFTAAFEDSAAWLAAHAPASAVAELLRTTWRTVSAIVTRVVARAAGRTDLLDGLVRIGIDEVSYRKGQNYLVCVVNHDTGALVWAAKGRDKATVEKFFAALGEERAKRIEVVSADAATWISEVVRTKAPNATMTMDPFHVVRWATDAVDQVRRRTVAVLKGQDLDEEATALKGSRWALLKNPENLTAGQKATLDGMKSTNDGLFTAYLLKEQLRDVFAQRGDKGKKLLAGWFSWVADAGLAAFGKVAASIKRILPAVHAALDIDVNNARLEASNTTLRMITRRGFGYHSADSLIAMAMLKRSGLCPPLPGRTTTTSRAVTKIT